MTEARGGRNGMRRNATVVVRDCLPTASASITGGTDSLGLVMISARAGTGSRAERIEQAGDPEVRLLIPVEDVPDPELSIVIPALNEEKTVGEFVAWCQQGLRAAGIAGEVLIVDSSTDDTANIA